jgi:hypothetical protein
LLEILKKESELEFESMTTAIYRKFGIPLEIRKFDDEMESFYACIGEKHWILNLLAYLPIWLYRIGELGKSTGGAGSSEKVQIGLCTEKSSFGNSKGWRLSGNKTNSINNTFLLILLWFGNIIFRIMVWKRSSYVFFFEMEKYIILQALFFFLMYQQFLFIVAAEKWDLPELHA